MNLLRWAFVAVVSIAPVAAETLQPLAGDPVLNFSDLTTGPSTGNTDASVTRNVVVKERNRVTSTELDL